ncbi:MAG: DUF1150 family protein [Phyllobacteriaceae bacterium]|nr:DUF1150 family protein [Phyllobacteriaceae bacterium]
MPGTSIRLSKEELAHVGEGAIGYVRKIKSDDMARRFPGMPDMAPGLDLWALFAANGAPILLTNQRDAALQGAAENELTPVSLH